MKAKIGWIFLLAIAQCSLNKKIGMMPLTCSRPRPGMIIAELLPFLFCEKPP